MNNLETITAAGVRCLPEDEDFLPNHKRNRTAFTAFRLSFFKTLQHLTWSEKSNYIRREMWHNNGLYNNPDVNYLDNENVIDVEEAYNSMFLPKKRRWNSHVLTAYTRKARIVFDYFPWSVTREWNRQADWLNQILVSGCFDPDKASSVLLGDLTTVYTDHLFCNTLFCFKQIHHYLMAGYDRKNTSKGVFS